MPSLDAYKAGYLADWARMRVHAKWQGAIDRAARYSITHRDRYVAVQRATGVPWALVAAWHYRESNGNFKGVLHNGEHIIGTGRVTRLVPAGRGPFSSWHEAAIDALKLKGLQLNRNWPTERICYESERFNGFGYRNGGRPKSPYLWSGSNIYNGPGKYSSDGVYSSGLTDPQIGCIPHYRRIMELTGPTFLPDTSWLRAIIDKVRTAVKGAWLTLAGLFSADNLGLLQSWFTGDDGKILTPENLLLTAVVLVGVWFLLKQFDAPEPVSAMADPEPENGEK